MTYASPPSQSKVKDGLIPRYMTTAVFYSSHEEGMLKALNMV